MNSCFESNNSNLTQTANRMDISTSAQSHIIKHSNLLFIIHLPNNFRQLQFQIFGFHFNYYLTWAELHCDWF